MKKVYLILAVVCGLGFLSMPTYANANGSSNAQSNQARSSWSNQSRWRQPRWRFPRWNQPRRPTRPAVRSVPEIDAAGAAIALALLAGVVSIGRERRKKIA